MGKALPDSVFLHAGQPQTRKRLFTPGLLINKPENQFSLPTGIATVHNAIHIRAVHELLQDTKLLFGAGRHQILPLFRQDGQVCNAPLDELFIVDIGRCQLHQMPDAPAHQIAVALQITVLSVGCTKDFGIGHGHRGLFRHD